MNTAFIMPLIPIGAIDNSKPNKPSSLTNSINKSYTPINLTYIHTYINITVILTRNNSDKEVYQ